MVSTTLALRVRESLLEGVSFELRCEGQQGPSYVMKRRKNAPGRGIEMSVGGSLEEWANRETSKETSEELSGVRHAGRKPIMEIGVGMLFF